MTQEEKIKELEERIAIMQAADSELCAELAHWKKVAAGLKGHNRQLAGRVEHYKQLDLEGDELYEKRLAEIDDLKAALCQNENVVKGLEDQVKEMSLTIKQQKEDIALAKSDASVAEANLEYYKSLPWYKKIFKR